MHLVRAVRTDDGFQWATEDWPTVRGAGFTAVGDVTLHAENGDSWLHIDGTFKLTAEHVHECCVPAIGEFGYPIEVVPDVPWVRAGAHLLPYVLLARLSADPDLIAAVPSRRHLQGGEPAACTYQLHEHRRAQTVTLRGTVHGITIHEPTSLRPVTCWIEGHAD